MAGELRVAIIGAGIHGLSTAFALCQANCCASIKIYARERTSDTTSAVAAGLIEPALVTAGEPKILRWFSATRRRLAELSSDPRWYIRRASVRAFWRAEEATPEWAALVDNFAVQPICEPPYRSEWRYVTEVVETPRYLAELVRNLSAYGVEFIEQNVNAPQELRNEADVIINCAGVFARHFGDTSVAPASGQVVVVERSSVIPDEVVLDDETLTYVIPRITDVVVGGTYVLDDWSRVPRPEVAADILRRAESLVPGLAQSRVLAHRIGLRPRRPLPRLELAPLPSTGAGGSQARLIAHCYGTGGSGISLAHGMAEELCEKILAALEG